MGIGNVSASRTAPSAVAITKSNRDASDQQSACSRFGGDPPLLKNRCSYIPPDDVTEW
jgi:hypothetical protein